MQYHVLPVQHLLLKVHVSFAMQLIKVGVINYLIV